MKKNHKERGKMGKDKPKTMTPKAVAARRKNIRKAQANRWPELSQFKCPVCKRIVTRDSAQKTVTSFCAFADGKVRLRRVSK